MHLKWFQIGYVQTITKNKPTKIVQDLFLIVIHGCPFDTSLLGWSAQIWLYVTWVSVFSHSLYVIMSFIWNIVVISFSLLSDFEFLPFLISICLIWFLNIRNINMFLKVRTIQDILRKASLPCFLPFPSFYPSMWPSSFCNRLNNGLLKDILVLILGNCECYLFWQKKKNQMKKTTKKPNNFSDVIKRGSL